MWRINGTGMAARFATLPLGKTRTQIEKLTKWSVRARRHKRKKKGTNDTTNWIMEGSGERANPPAAVLRLPWTLQATTAVREPQAQLASICKHCGRRCYKHGPNSH